MTEIVGMVAVECTDPNCPDGHGHSYAERLEVRRSPERKARRKAQKAARRRNR